MKTKGFLGILVFLLLLVGCQKAIVKPESSGTPDTATLTLASFNL